MWFNPTLENFLQEECIKTVLLLNLWTISLFNLCHSWTTLWMNVVNAFKRSQFDAFEDAQFVAFDEAFLFALETNSCILYVII